MSEVSVRKVGVEEELLLVDREGGQLCPLAPDAVRAAATGWTSAELADVEVAAELFRQQIETSTSPCRESAELADEIRAGRRAVCEAAAAAGARAVAMPTPVLRLPEPGSFTAKSRYHRIRDAYGELAQQALVCAMHMHVDVDGEEEGVVVCDRIRPWLPVLVALSANSPFWNGVDTAHASWRSQVWNRWPSAGPQEPFGDVATYRETSERMKAWGAALDDGMLYFDVRLSETYPTIEIRVCDVVTEVEDAVVVAALARAMVATAAGDTGSTGPPAPWRADLLRTATWRAARWGVTGDLVHPDGTRLAPASEVAGAALRWCRDALSAAGDLDLVRDGVARVLGEGNGAQRQRRVHEATGSLDAVVDHLAERTTAG